MKFVNLFTISALSSLAVAIPTPGYGGGEGGDTVQCNTGPVQCCDQVVPAKDAPASALTQALLLGVVLQNLNVPIGLDCSPVSVISGGNGACQSAPVCCENNSNGGLVSVGCIPISV